MRTRNPPSLRTVGTEIITYRLGYCDGSVPGSVASTERVRRIESVPSGYYCCTFGVPASKHCFIQCTRAPFFVEAAGRAKQRGFQYHELLSARPDAMITEPTALARILV